MRVLYRVLKSDFLKMKHSVFYRIHFLTPITGLVLFLSYYSFSKWSPTSKVQGYIEVLAIAFPLLISIVCSFAVEQEALAGNFKELLSTEYGRSKAFISKVCMLLICGFCSTVLAVGGFAAGFHLMLKQNEFPLSFYCEISLIIFGCQIFIYILHLLLSFRFSKGVSIGVGITESLLAALMITGLGDIIWKFIPCAWGARLCDYFLAYKFKPNYFNVIQADAKMGSAICISLTLIGVIISLIWFSFYEGRKEI